MKTYEELQSENAELLAMSEVIKQNLAQCYPHIKSADRKLCFSLGEVLQLIEKSLESLPQQCLAQIRAEAGRAGYLQCLKDLGRYSDEDKLLTAGDSNRMQAYAAKVRGGGEG